MKNKLQDYVAGKDNYQSLLNFMNEKRDIFEILGKYAYEEVFNKVLPKKLEFYNDLLSNKNIIKKMTTFYDKKQAFSSFAILLLTHSEFVMDKLRELYGEPIYHDEFGEGFDGEYNEETDDFDEPEIKESFASYFLNIEGVDLHIGYDHRGLTIEAKKGTSGKDLTKALEKFLYLMYKDNNKIQ